MKTAIIVLLLFLFCKPAYAAPAITVVSMPTTGIKYEKWEASFQINTTATNPFFFYDANPPAGSVGQGTGISVDGVFTSPGGTVFTQPAFYYQDFDYQIKGGAEWMYPNGNYFWRVRFSPNVPGSWKFHLKAQDGTGTAVTSDQNFTVADSTNKGFIKVSTRDSRYFEFDDGTYFPGLGYNMNYDHIKWDNPVTANQTNFQKMGQNGVQLIRMWLSEWGIYGLDWNGSWNVQNDSQWGYNSNWRMGVFDRVFPGSESSMFLDQESPCISLGLSGQTPAIKQNTKYHVSARVKTENLVPKDTSRPYGFVLKFGDWLWSDDPTQRCDYPGVGTVVSSYQSADTPNWTTIEADIDTTNAFVRWHNPDFLMRFHLTLENTSRGNVWVDSVSIKEILPNGAFGPDIVPKPSASMLSYVDQKRSFAFDIVLDLAKQYGVYLRPVIMEKNDRLYTFVKDDGTVEPDYHRATDNNFYAAPNTKNRWRQQAWWRYLQARWGYSTHVHSWEMINEGNPDNGRHAAQAEAFGQFMHQFKPNDHLVSTSNWSSTSSFVWENCPSCDFTDFHWYLDKESDQTRYYDSALGSFEINNMFYQQYLGEIGKPIVRGEVSFFTNGEPSMEISSSTNSVWLHNFIWGGIGPSGVVDQYWDDWLHVYSSPNGAAYDHRKEYGNYYKFIKNIPLNKGGYVDAGVSFTNTNLRVWGQKNTSAKRLHLWIANKNNTWQKALSGTSATPISDTITVSGFSPNQQLPIIWWNTYTGQPMPNDSAHPSIVYTNGNGQIILSVSNLTTDLAVKIGDYTPTVDKVDIFDLRAALAAFQNIFAINSIIANYGK